MANLVTLDAKHPVERSRLLDVFNFSQYTPDEMLLLDVYLSKINPADPKTKRVQFRKKEYELFLERGKQKTNAFKKAALGLFGKFIDPDHLPEDIEFDPKHVWKELSFKKEGNEWVFTMECDEQSEPFFFNTQKYGFIRYLVGYTRNFTSKHSFILYYYLKRKRQEELRFGNPINPTVAELKRLTGTGSKKTYKEFKYFKRDVLDKAVEEITCFTDIDVTYETVKIGRRTDRIHFTVLEKATPPLLGHKEAEPSKELTDMFADELEEMKKLPAPEAPEKVKVRLLDGREAWVDKRMLFWDEKEHMETSPELEAILAASSESEASDLQQTKKAKSPGRPKKAKEPVHAETAPEPAEEPEKELTDFERDLLATIPEEVHKGDLARVEAIINSIRRYVQYPDFLEYFKDGMSFEQASREAADEFNEIILDKIHTFNIQEYNIRKGGIMNKEAHFKYYLVALEGWLLSHS